jgi:pimeloyl-ACP methyl ester carboxylesterase
MSDSPTLIFTPGAWHRPTCYTKVMTALQEQYNITCTSFALPSTNGDPKATFKDDLDAARATISSETIQGHNVILIAHSYGGMVVNSAIKGFTEPRGITKDASKPAQGRVIGLILIASGFTLTGLSFMDPLFGIPPPTWRVNKATGFADIVTSPAQLFYHDLPADEAEEWVAQLTPQSLKALFEGGEHSYAGWLDVPVLYIGTVEDQGLPVLVQRAHVGMARAMGASVVHRELRSSHSPFLSQPDEVVDLLLEATTAFTGSTVGVEEFQGPEGRREVLTPAVTIGQPSTWLKYGIPLVIGHIIGRCILLFYATRGLRRSATAADMKAD